MEGTFQIETRLGKIEIENHLVWPEMLLRLQKGYNKNYQGMVGKFVRVE